VTDARPGRDCPKDLADINKGGMSEKSVRYRNWDDGLDGSFLAVLAPNTARRTLVILILTFLVLSSMCRKTSKNQGKFSGLGYPSVAPSW
jgi:hypothetical protein